jgi:hypothetical protein
MDSKLTQSLFMGLVFALTGLISAWYAQHAWPIFLKTAILTTVPFAGILVGTLLWWLLIARDNSYSVTRGFWIGILISVLIHPFVWYFEILHANICFHLLHDNICANGNTPMNPLQGIQGAFFYSNISWYALGWITIPIGGIIGALATYWQKHQ